MTSSTAVARQALEQGHALAQRRRELDLAAHGALGDGGDMRLQADMIGELVDAFLADHGRIHVGEEQRLAAAARRLHHDVDGRAGERRAHAIGDSAAVDRLGVVLGALKGMSAAMPGSSQIGACGDRQRGARAFDRGGIERGRRGI